MDKRKIVKLQLVALALLTLLVLYRVLSGPAAPEGLVVFNDLEVSRLTHAAILLPEPGTFVVSGTGSFAGTAEGQPRAMAAYGWILRRSDRSIAWMLDAARATPTGRGMLAAVTDTLRLQEGTYDVYFATYGNRTGDRPSFLGRLTGRSPDWRQDQRNWELLVHPVDAGAQKARRVKREEARERAPSGDHVIWSSAPMRGRKTAEHVFEVVRPAQVQIYALGELSPGNPMDFGWLEDAVTEGRVWEMSGENTEPAGGWQVNRLFKGELALPAGVYRAGYKTDRRHSFGDWTGNPPHDPAAWGLTLSAARPADVQAIIPFDPWQTRQPVVSLSPARNNELHEAQINVTQPVHLAVHALGEISGSDRYDYGWILNNQTQEAHWEMTRQGSEPAGGHETNRRALTFVNLEPGTYTVYYRTDDSHAFEGWAKAAPEHPERWGISLFPLDMSDVGGAIEILSHSVTVGDGESSEEGEEPDAPPPPPPPPALDASSRMLHRTRLGNEANEEVPFSIKEATQVRIYALGEISMSGRYDYGWIEDAATGQRVWEMHWQNTVPAGGDDSNRLFDGLVTLEPGNYKLHFTTDFSHAFGDFGDRAPDHPEAWGITVEKQ